MNLTRVKNMNIQWCTLFIFFIEYTVVHPIYFRYRFAHFHTLNAGVYLSERFMALGVFLDHLCRYEAADVSCIWDMSFLFIFYAIRHFEICVKPIYFPIDELAGGW